MPHSTISTILKDKAKVKVKKNVVKSSSDFKAVITTQRKSLIHGVAKLLTIWFDNQIQKRLPMSLLIIQPNTDLIDPRLPTNSLYDNNGTSSLSEVYQYYTRYNTNTNHF